MSERPRAAGGSRPEGKRPEALYVGSMSGTSLDGIDVAVVAFEGEEERPGAARLVAFRSYPYEAAFRQRLLDALEGATPAVLSRLNFDLGERLGASIGRALEECGIEPERVRAVGSHGQTVWHEPPDASQGGHTLQIGEPAAIVEVTGIPVIADFRVRDMAAGGQGAPLSAYFDWLLLSTEGTARAIQNLGGMGNVTALPADAADPPLAFDTGPGVALIDGCVRQGTAGRQSYDLDGRLAAAGTAHEPALLEWLADSFFATPPPRSTGRERFGQPRLEAWLARHASLSEADRVATLTELTARAVADSYRWIPFALDEVYLCGGGASNPELSRRIAERLAPLPVRGLERLGWDPDAREAAAFALLARQHLLGIAIDLGWATGARGPRVLGKRVPA